MSSSRTLATGLSFALCRLLVLAITTSALINADCYSFEGHASSGEEVLAKFSIPNLPAPTLSPVVNSNAPGYARYEYHLENLKGNLVTLNIGELHGRANPFRRGLLAITVQLTPTDVGVIFGFGGDAEDVDAIGGEIILVSKSPAVMSLFAGGKFPQKLPPVSDWTTAVIQNAFINPPSGMHVSRIEKIDSDCPALTCQPAAEDEARRLRFVPQQQPSWCWAAVAQMLMDTARPEGEDHQQCEIAEMARFGAVNGRICSAAPAEGFTKNKPTKWDGGSSILKVLDRFGFSASWKAAGIFSKMLNTDITTSLVKEEISCHGRPLGFRWTNGNAHEMIIYGYRSGPNDELQLLVYNPDILPGEGAPAYSQNQRAIICMFSQTCTIRFEDFLNPSPYAFVGVYAQTRKKE